jgi:hypothetical protein
MASAQVPSLRTLRVLSSITFPEKKYEVEPQGSSHGSSTSSTHSSFSIRAQITQVLGKVPKSSLLPAKNEMLLSRTMVRLPLVWAAAIAAVANAMMMMSERDMAPVHCTLSVACVSATHVPCVTFHHQRNTPHTSNPFPFIPLEA